MTRKHNRSEKDIIITSTPAAAAARPRRTAAPRAGNSAAAPVTPPAPAVETETPTSSTFVTEQELSREEVARLAYEFWLARGCQHGNPEEDWRRAEEELRRRLTAPLA